MKLNFFFLSFCNHEKKLYLFENYTIVSCLYTALLLLNVDYILKLLINILNKLI